MAITYMRTDHPDMRTDRSDEGQSRKLNAKDVDPKYPKTGGKEWRECYRAIRSAMRDSIAWQNACAAVVTAVEDGTLEGARTLYDAFPSLDEQRGALWHLLQGVVVNRSHWPNYVRVISEAVETDLSYDGPEDLHSDLRPELTNNLALLWTFKLTVLLVAGVFENELSIEPR